jgi:DNA-binding NarL/FixJ family response regulator
MRVEVLAVEPDLELQPESSMTSPELRVLLVEDSRILSEKIMELLCENRFIQMLGSVTTEEDAIALLRGKTADAVVLDLRLSRGSGFGVLEYIATLEHRPRVIVLTNYSLLEYKRRAQHLGAEYFLDKSRDFPRLPELLEAMRQELAS